MPPRSISPPKLLLLLFALITTATAARADSFKDIGKFENGDRAIFIRSVIRADRDRRASISFIAPKLGGTLYFRQEDWALIAKAVPEALEATKQLAAGATRLIATIESPSGGQLQIEALNEANRPALRITRLEHKGGTYPNVPVVLLPEDFPRLREAVIAVTNEFTTAKPKGYY